MMDNMFLEETYKIARIARDHAKSDAYCVGAVLRCKNGYRYTGCNIENASHISVPAEIVAFTKALSEGAQCFESLVVVGGPKNTDDYSKYVPCKESIEFMQAYVDNDFVIYNIYEPVRGKSEIETYTIESLSFLNNYCLKMTEQYSRTYYSATPKIIKTETTLHQIKKGLELPTAVYSIDIKDFSYKGNGVFSVFVEFLNEDLKLETVEITTTMSKTITLTEGNPDVFRTSICKLELVEKDNP